MHSTLTTALLLAASTLSTAHFNLDYPKARGFDEDKLTNFPCGSQDTVSKDRTEWPVGGGSIALNMGHDEAKVQVLLGLGSDPGSNFNITLLPTIQEQGLGNFCLDKVTVPSDLAIKDGDVATIQVVTNGDPTGGLYNCADIIFRTSPPAPSACKNNTGVTTVPLSGKVQNANGTDSDAAATTSATPTATPKNNGASRGSVEWAVGLVTAAVVGFAVCL